MNEFDKWGDRWSNPLKHLNRLTLAQACVAYPEAMVYFDLQCGHLQNKENLYFQVVKNKLRAISAIDQRQTIRAIWHPDVSIWIRYSHGISSRPRRSERACEVRAVRYVDGEYIIDKSRSEVVSYPPNTLVSGDTLVIEYNITIE